MNERCRDVVPAVRAWGMHLVDFPRPHTHAAHGALALADQYQSAAITAHAIRSWLWAEAFAVVEDLRGVDHELLYVAAILHDIGIVSEYDNHTISYEHAGGHVGVALTAGAGWPAERRQRVLDVIVRHNWTTVDPGILDVEGHLLEIATGLYISGTRSTDLPRSSCARYSRRTRVVTLQGSSRRAWWIRPNENPRLPHVASSTTGWPKSFDRIRWNGFGDPQDASLSRPAGTAIDVC